MGERQKIGRKPQGMWLLPLSGTSLQAEKCLHILLLVYNLMLSNLILPCFSPGFIPQFFHCTFKLIPCLCSPEHPTCSLQMHHNYFILPRFVESVISFKNMNNNGYFFVCLFAGKWPFLLLSDWWTISKVQLSKVVFVLWVLSENLEVFSSSEFVQQLSRRFEIGKLGFNQIIISFLWFL